MNQTFDITRFGKLLQSELLINKGAIGKVLSALVLALLVMYYVWVYIMGVDGQMMAMLSMAEATNAYAVIANNFAPLLWIILFLVPLFVYYNLYDKVKSVSLAMLPASKLEKFLSAIVQVGVLLPVLLILVFSIFLLIIHPISFSALDADWGKLTGDLFETSIYWIGMQSFLFLGVFWFKENKIRKLILSFIAIVVLLSVLSYIIAETSIGADTATLSSTNDFVVFLADNYKTIFKVLFPLVPWVIAYNKFVRTQI